MHATVNVYMRNISIHAPCVGGDRVVNVFLHILFNFNPRPLRRGRPEQSQTLQQQQDISIHAPCVGGDHFVQLDFADREIFQSTPPA